MRRQLQDSRTKISLYRWYFSRQDLREDVTKSSDVIVNPIKANLLQKAIHRLIILVVQTEMHGRHPLEVSDEGYGDLSNFLAVGNVLPRDLKEFLNVILFVKKFVYSCVCVREYV